MDDSAVTAEKRLLRERFLKMRKGLSRESVESRSDKIIRNLEKHIRFPFKSVLLYIPINNEVDLLPLAKRLFMNGHSVLFPKLVRREKIVPYIIHDLDFDFKPGAYNIPEPDTEPYEGSIDLVFVPGLVFGQDGYRIGYGKSYYDRFLAESDVRKTIGVCFDFQLLKTVPRASHDYPIQAVQSETHFLENR